MFPALRPAHRVRCVRIAMPLALAKKLLFLEVPLIIVFNLFYGITSRGTNTPGQTFYEKSILFTVVEG